MHRADPQHRVTRPHRRAGQAARHVVLLVEDEAALRRLIAMVLREEGYTLLEAADGAEALRVSAGHDEPIDLLVTDLTMPGLGGVELARRLRDVYPGLRVMFVSGHPDLAPEDRRRDPEAVFLQKPFTCGTLLERLGLMLSGTSA